MELSFEINKVSDLSASDYDGILFVSFGCTEKTIPKEIKDVITQSSELDKNIHDSISVLSLNLPATRLIYSPTGRLNLEYDDVRSYGEAAKKGILRAIKAGVTKPILALVHNENFNKTRLVTLLGALEGLYLTLQHRELRPEVSPKVKKLGIWSDDQSGLEELIKIGTALECGRIVARDIGGPDPERMTPANVETYVKNVFKSDSGIKLEVISDEKVIDKEYPLFSAVNRAASVIERHKGRIIFLTYEGTDVKETLYIVGKGVTYDTGGADIKAGGIMIGMCRDKCGSAAVAGFMKVLSYLKPANLKVVGVMGMVRNSVGENAYVSDEIIMSRAKRIVRVGNTDAEGRMIMADILCKVKEMSLDSINPHLMTIATLTGHAKRTVGPGYTIGLDNGPARKTKNVESFAKSGEEIGDMMEISRIRREDYDIHRGKIESEDVVQHLVQPASQAYRGHQSPAAFLILSAGLDEHGIESKKPIRYTHLDINPSCGQHPDIPTGSPVLLLANNYLKF